MCQAIVMFAVVGLTFHSIVIPLRAVLTVLTTLAFTYGCASLVYIHGALQWTGIPGLQKTGEIHFMVPLLDFPIVVALAVDGA